MKRSGIFGVKIPEGFDITLVTGAASVVEELNPARVVGIMGDGGSALRLQLHSTKL